MTSRRKKFDNMLLRWIRVDTGALRHNVRAVRQSLGPGVKFTAVVKSDAYGHGAAEVSRVALAHGADSLAVAYLEEALALRREGVRAPLLVMGPVLPEDAPLVVRHRLAVMVDNDTLARALNRAAPRSRPVPVHVKVNLGLFRWGLPLDRLPKMLADLARLRSLRIEGVFAHPGYMAGKNGQRIVEALDDFLSVARSIQQRTGANWELHAADSAILMDYPEYRLSRVRVGNLIYGINTAQKKMILRNPWTALARIVHVERLAPGQAVGYGGEFVSSGAITVGTLRRAAGSTSARATPIGERCGIGSAL
jgi:alanine racemase